MKCSASTFLTNAEGAMLSVEASCSILARSSGLTLTCRSAVRFWRSVTSHPVIRNIDHIDGLSGERVSAITKELPLTGTHKRVTHGWLSSRDEMIGLVKGFALSPLNTVHQN